MYTCSEVVKLVSSDEYLQAGNLKKLGVRLHLLLCKYCRKYVTQLRALAATLRETDLSISAPEIERVKARILQELA